MLQSHPDPSLDYAWKYAQIGLICLPYSVVLGGICLLISLVWVSFVRRNTILQQRFTWTLVGLACALILTTCLARYPLEAGLGLANFLPCFWFFVGFRELVQTPIQLKRMSWILALNSIPIVCIGLIELYGSWVTPIRFLAIIDWPLAAGGTPVGRMAAVFAYANVLASYLHVTFAITVGLIVPYVTDFPDVIKRPIAFPFTQMAILSLALGFNGLGLILTQSRNAWGVAFFTLVCFALYLRWYPLILFLLGLTGSVTWAAFGSIGRDLFRQIIPQVFWARLNDVSFVDRPLADLRITQWQFAWSMTLERPWTGWGLRNFTPLYETVMQTWMGHPHNLFLMLTAETGIPIALALSCFVAWIMIQAIRSWRMGNSPDTRIRTIPTTQSEANDALVDNLNLPNRSAAQDFADRVKPISRTAINDEERLILFTYLVAFGGCVLFGLFDVTLFDFRINLLNWFLLAGIAGVSQFRDRRDLFADPYLHTTHP